MNGYIAFTKKEIMENIRNYRLLMMLSLFLFFGVSSPLIAKFTPQLIESFAVNMEVTVMDPSAFDAWSQFYKNVSSLGLSLTIILFSSCLSGEYAKGTLTIMLTKGLSRKGVILSKFVAAVSIMTFSYWLSFFVSYAYIAYLWPGSELNYLFFAGFSIWIIALLFLCILMLGCVLFRQAFTSILFLLAITVVISLMGMTSQFEALSPSFLMSRNIDLLNGSLAIYEFIPSLVNSLVSSVVLMILSVVIFDNKQL